jgi:hypothetical protein
MLLRVAILLVSIPALLLAQTPSGSVYGTVYDPSGAVVPHCHITITDQQTATSRTLLSGADGTYFASMLPVGQYDLLAEAAGFHMLMRFITLNAGEDTFADVHLQLKQATEQVNVRAASPDLHFDTAAVDGLVSRTQIESLPLNGRNFLQLATLVPGVAVTPGYPALFNRQFDVSILGGDKLNTIIAVDGGSVWDQTTGGTGINLSQEVVQEFQVASANFDPSTGITAYGAINVVTRSGGNDFHGAGYFYYRDHNLAAYPGLTKNALAPNPYFARKQPGFWAGGPIRKSRSFYFLNLENNIQDSVFVVQPNSALLSGLAEVGPSPYRGRQFSSRFDEKLPRDGLLMARYSHDGNRTTAPPSAATVSPSNWMQNQNWSDQGLMTISHSMSPATRNDFRFSFWYWNNRNIPITRNECTAACFGYGLPEIHILGTNFTVGDTENAPQGRISRRWSYNDSISWDKFHHQFHIGGEAVHENIGGYWDLADPGVLTVYSPDLLSSLGELGLYGLSSGLHTTADILKLPLYDFFTGVGDPSQPQPFDRDRARQNDRFHLFVSDIWRVQSNFTINYGLSWSYEDNLLNFDLPKPAYLEPIFGSRGLRAGDHNFKNFSPSLGMSWQVGHDNRTVVRAGAGIYFDTQLLWQRGEERSYLGPFPNGHVIIDGSSISNFVPGIPGAPVGQPISYPNAPTGFTAGLLVQLLPPIRTALSQAFGTSGTDLSFPTIDVSKSAADLLPEHFPTAYGEHFSVGVQREMSHAVISADFVLRQHIHVLFDDVNTPDYNHFNAAVGPLIPRCIGAQASDPTAECSTGPITVWTPGGRAIYRALLLKADKRLGGRFQFGLAYALASQVGFDASNGFADLKHWFSNYGPLGPRHSLTGSAVWNFPWSVQASLISSYASRPPVMPFIDQVDLSGSGTTYSLLPGLPFNCFNRGCNTHDLIRAIDTFNNIYAGKLTARGQAVPTITLPPTFGLCEGFSAQDARVGKTMAITEHLHLKVFAESFNLFNIANRSGYNFNLNSPLFGQPTQRVGQTFGSGGPRAFQFGSRVSF